MAWERTIINDGASTQDTVDLIIETINSYHDQPEIDQLINSLDQSTLNGFLYSLFRYMDTIIYEMDPEGIERVTTPRRLVLDGKGDCKKMSVFIASVLKRCNIPVLLKVVSYNGTEWAHIYPVVPLNNGEYITMDPVNNRQYNKEVNHEVWQLFNLDKDQNMQLQQLGRKNYGRNSIVTSAFDLEGELAGVSGLAGWEWVGKAAKGAWKGIKWIWGAFGKDTAEKAAENFIGRKLDQQEQYAMALAQSYGWGPVTVRWFQPKGEDLNVKIEGIPPIQEGSMIFLNNSGPYTGGHFVKQVWQNPADPGSLNVILPATFQFTGGTFISPSGVPTNWGSEWGAVMDDDAPEEPTQEIKDQVAVIDQTVQVSPGGGGQKPPSGDDKKGGWILPVLAVVAALSLFKK